VRWLGTASFVIESAGSSLVIDPYLTRASLRQLAFAPLLPDRAAIDRHAPKNLVAVLCGHSHFDHLLDAPLLSQVTGAKLVGSDTTLAFGRAQGLPETQLLSVPALGAELELGPFAVRFIPSRHAALLLGRVPFPGSVDGAVPELRRPWHYRMGGAFGVLVSAGGVSIYHNGSADLVDAELRGVEADVALVGLAGRRYTPAYLQRLLTPLAPKLVLPSHHDAFFGPLEAGVRLLPGIEFERFVRDTERFAPRAQILAPLYDEPVWIAPHGSDAGISSP